ncbi:hypothetical protein Q7689_00070 [Nocardiopsis tropica]|uniref:hypothetical protein n=1 Tax=Nocardiopsis tropica TaxID=109330 RepID=UPI002E85364D|nr:hypothetical protein [Nocardiopsis tropica]
MTYLTDTLTISATRVLDLARDVTLQLGEWQFHRDLTVSVNNRHGGAPLVYMSLSPDANDSTRREFIDAFAAAMDTPVAVLPCRAGGHLLSVSVSDFDRSGVTVAASVQVAS